ATSTSSSPTRPPPYLLYPNSPFPKPGRKPMPADGSAERKTSPTSNTPPLSNTLARNEGTPLRTDWFEGAQVNTSAAERRASTLTTRRTVKKEYQAAWLVKAVTLMDLT